jgi:hypothetical protein
MQEFDVGREIARLRDIEHADALAMFAEPGNQMPSDKAATSGDKNARHD